ncbi:uncharacterized protein LOC119084635 [Bradysia coprophila]|uniref:uncharacterized protein LOC119084635 n=1 Tax=Bradysia coprophila TaxID=38358 RepID=UPI00187D8A76|nr:uncharacterized protein LOC119084635 [Bradysia coprophila]
MFTIFYIVAIVAKFANSQDIWNENRPIVSYECDPASPTVVTDITIGPCFDNWGCKMPNCCGIISGKLTNISLTYIASIASTTATTHGFLVGLAAGSAENQVFVPVENIQVPNAVVTYDYDSCRYTTCPQAVGNTYRFDGMFTVPTTAVTTMTLIAHFVAQLTSDEPGNPVIVCKKIMARIVNVDLIQSYIDVLKNAPFGG